MHLTRHTGDDHVIPIKKMVKKYAVCDELTELMAQS